MEYSQSGSWTSIIALLVAGLSKYDIIISQSDAVQIVAGAIALFGVIRQYFAHKKLAVSASQVGRVAGLSPNFGD